MNKKQTTRLEAIIMKTKAVFMATESEEARIKHAERVAAACEEFVSLAMVFLKKMAKSDFSLEVIFDAIEKSEARGTMVPCIRLGLVPAPKSGQVWMANARYARVDYTLEDVREIYGPLARQ